MFFGRLKEIDKEMSGAPVLPNEKPVIRVKARSREDVFS